MRISEKSAVYTQQLLYYFSLIFLLSCNWRVAHFRVRSEEKFKNYSLKIPSNCTCSLVLQENSVEKFYYYPDSSYFFFSDEVLYHKFGPEVHSKYGRNINLIFLGIDTLTLSGTDSEGKYWLIRKNKDVVYGYRKVQYDNKDKLDAALNSVHFYTDSNLFVQEGKMNKIAAPAIGEVSTGKCKRF